MDDLETIVTGGFLESIETNERVVSNLPQFMVISCHPGSMMTILLRNELLVYCRMYRCGEFVFLEPVFFSRKTYSVCEDGYSLNLINNAITAATKVFRNNTLCITPMKPKLWKMKNTSK